MQLLKKSTAAKKKCSCGTTIRIAACIIFHCSWYKYNGTCNDTARTGPAQPARNSGRLHRPVQGLRHAHQCSERRPRQPQQHMALQVHVPRTARHCRACFRQDSDCILDKLRPRNHAAVSGLVLAHGGSAEGRGATAPAAEKQQKTRSWIESRIKACVGMILCYTLLALDHIPRVLEHPLPLHLQ